MVRVGVFGLGYEMRSRVAPLALCVAVGLAGFGAGVLVAQDEKVPTLHVYTNLVQIPALVLNQDRKPMALIAERRFFVSLDGGPRFRVTHARLEGEDPISLAILMDVSQPYPSLMRGIDDALAGLSPLSLHTRDHVSVYSLECQLIRSADDVPADAATLRRAVDVALQSWSAVGQDRHKRDCQKPSNLWDSLAGVTEALSRQPGRRVVLVVTDGLDRGSKNSWNGLRDFAQVSGVAIFGLIQPDDAIGLLRAGSPNQENAFNSVCELSGGMVLTATQKNLAEQLKWFARLLRGRYIVEFPRPVDTIGENHDMDISVEHANVFIRPAGISMPADDAAVLNDPTTISSDPSHAPQLGKRKILTPR